MIKTNKKVEKMIHKGIYIYLFLIKLMRFELEPKDLRRVFLQLDKTLQINGLFVMDVGCWS